MLRSFLLYLSEKEFPKKFLTSHPFGRRMAARFIAGEDLEDAVSAVRRLNGEGLEATLDYLGEAVSEPRCHLAIFWQMANPSRKGTMVVKSFGER